MEFQKNTTINYDPHHVISIRRKVNKNNPFERQQVEGLTKSSNWLNYPLVTRNEEDMQQGSTSLVQDVNGT